MSTPDDELADARPRASRRAKIWGWVGVGVFAMIVCTYAFFAAQDPLRWKDVGFSIDSPTQAEATFDIYFYEQTDALCHLKALNEHFAEVGVTDVLVKRADGVDQRITASIVTTEEATTALVKYCEPAP